MSCYIMQDDCLSPHLSVMEAMTVSANLKIGKSVSHSDKKAIINEVLEILGLQDCLNTASVCLSGGQRKRLSIALELVNNPPVMFFDEPTSGLDSSSCFQCLCLLKSLARGGRTIICTIHQPSARLFEMFDNLYMLAEGQCIYRGPVTNLVPFLSSMGLNCPSYHNPADYVMEVACGEHGDYVQKLVVAVNAGRCNTALSKALEATGQKLIANDIAKETMPMKPNGECLNLPNGSSKNPGLVPPTCTTSLLVPLEMSVFVREHLNYWYSLKAYYFAKTLADVPFQIILTTCYIVGVYFITDQPLDATRFFMFLLIAVLTALVSQSFGLLVGAAFNIESGVFLGPISTVPMVLFSGFFAKLEDIPFYFQWLPYLSYVKYSFEGTMVAIYGLNRSKLVCNRDYCHFKYPSAFLDEMSLKGDMLTYFIDIGVLSGLFVFLRIVAYFVLRIRLFQNR
ncbi:hypothetical protein D910_11720 [Dendroctonus ponderosae]|uniref:ABC transporter domain-containing protein n=1 Tax=Dendroctonus ponderosae TaxID=77166 RepID=U4UPN1_DENPD|nr:hypothetical protein D910_11720 [Dendroctonus ponderosae]